MFCTLCCFFFCSFDLFQLFSVAGQNLNKQAYDLAKALLKRTAQAIEPYITNVSFSPKRTSAQYIFFLHNINHRRRLCWSFIWTMSSLQSDSSVTFSPLPVLQPGADAGQDVGQRSIWTRVWPHPGAVQHRQPPAAVSAAAARVQAEGILETQPSIFSAL